MWLDMNKKNSIPWKRVLLFVLLFCIILAIIYGVYSLRQIYKSKVDRHDEVEAFVIEHSDITSIQEIDHFQDEEGYYTLIAEDKKGEMVYVFLRDDESFSTKNLYIVPAKTMKEPETFEDKLKENCKACEIVRSAPAMIDGVPLWELTYYDEEDRYVIEYKYLENGNTYEKLSLSRKYKKE